MRLPRLDQEIEDMLECRKRALEMKWPKPVVLPISESEVEKDVYGFLDS